VAVHGCVYAQDLLALALAVELFEATADRTDPVAKIQQVS
jgi:hypothetical protein